jgi:hypothetical protein
MTSDEPTDAQDSTGERRPPPRRLRYHSTAGARPMPAGQVIVVGIIALGLAALLNADSLYATAHRQPYGWRRTVLTDLVGPVRSLSSTLRLNRPRQRIERAIGREPSPGSGPVEQVTVTTVPPTSAGTPTTTTAPLRQPTSALPLSLWVGGDSMANDFGAAVERIATSRGDITATRDSRISTGLTRPDYFNWPVHLRDDVLPTKPEVMVIIFGANDAQPLELDGSVRQVESPEWQAEYRARVATTMDLLRSPGRRVIWVGQPRMRSSTFDAHMQILDGIYQSEAAKRPWIEFLDSRPVLAGADGGYAPYLPGPGGQLELARQGDGIHLSRFGADKLAARVFDLIDREMEGNG